MSNDEGLIRCGLIPIKEEFACNEITALIEVAEERKHLSLVASHIIGEHLSTCEECAGKYSMKLHDLMIMSINTMHDMMMKSLEAYDDEVCEDSCGEEEPLNPADFDDPGDSEDSCKVLHLSDWMNEDDWDKLPKN